MPGNVNSHSFASLSIDPYPRFTLNIFIMSLRQLKITNSVTARDSISLNKYLQEIGKIKMISPDEETALCSRVREGDRCALEKLVKANLRFVVSVAKQYQGNGIPLADLVNEGNIGLVKAARKFDETRGFRFISFAVWWIRQEIVQSVARQAQVIRLPLNKSVLISKIRKASLTLEQELQRQADPEEIAEFLNINVEDVRDAMGIVERTLSLDAPLGEDDDNSCLADMIADNGTADADESLVHGDSLKTEIIRRLNMLNDRQKETICCFFGIGGKSMTLEDIATRFQLTTERVRQIKEKALEKLKASCNFKVLKEYL